MFTTSKPKEEKKSVDFTEKQKQKRAAKRRLLCTYCKKRGHIEPECSKKKRYEDKPPSSTARTTTQHPKETTTTISNNKSMLIYEKHRRTYKRPFVLHVIAQTALLLRDYQDARIANANSSIKSHVFKIKQIHYHFNLIMLQYVL